MIIVRGGNTLIQVGDLTAVVPTAVWYTILREAEKRNSNPKTDAIAAAMRAVHWPIGGFTSYHGNV